MQHMIHVRTHNQTTFFAPCTHELLSRPLPRPQPTHMRPHAPAARLARRPHALRHHHLARPQLLQRRVDTLPAARRRHGAGQERAQGPQLVHGQQQHRTAVVAAFLPARAAAAGDAVAAGGGGAADQGPVVGGGGGGGVEAPEVGGVVQQAAVLGGDGQVYGAA